MREAMSLQRGNRKRSLKSSHRSRLPQLPWQEKRSSQHSPQPLETVRPSAASRSSQKTDGSPQGPPGQRISTRSMQRVSKGKNTSGRYRKRQRPSSVQHSNQQGFYNFTISVLLRQRNHSFRTKNTDNKFFRNL